jgi:hypothetical protein
MAWCRQVHVVWSPALLTEQTLQPAQLSKSSIKKSDVTVYAKEEDGTKYYIRLCKRAEISTILVDSEFSGQQPQKSMPVTETSNASNKLETAPLVCLNIIQLFR